MTLLRCPKCGYIVALQPAHEHDCDKCIFLGRSGPWSLGAYDYYFCEQHGGIPTVIARNGPEGSYKSGLLFGAIGADRELAEALHLAVSTGLLVGREDLLASFGYLDLVIRWY